MKRPAVLEESIPYISKMAIGNAGMECRNSKRVPPFSPHLFRKGKKSAKAENHKETQDSRNPLQGRNDGRLMPGARRRTPYRSGRRPCRHRTHWARWAIGDTGFLCSACLYSSNLIPQICPFSSDRLIVSLSDYLFSSILKTQISILSSEV